ncbi:hydrolase [Desulfuromonas versatilis]|uniref:phosphoglycolate phosphatase n=2 Tax=Desulfuromonas versatilis TaxID=2802975 RepID=A0ABM8I0J0_9BACT|nr:hydrolase [Desulfuromonas versatilis]
MSMENPPLEQVRAVLFDLDGTLLGVEMSKFIPAYLEGLSGHFADQVDRRAFARVLTATTFALLRSDDGSRSNQEMLLEAVGLHLGIGRAKWEQGLAAFFREGLEDLEKLITSLPLAREILERCFSRNLQVVVATNPVFPKPLVDARLQWGNLHDFPFALVTSYENCRYCKPHPGYFQDILQSVGLQPGQCVMVGNDTEHDLAARQAGIPTFLVDTWLVDRQQGSFTTDYRGGHEDLLEFVGRLGQDPPPISGFGP